MSLQTSSFNPNWKPIRRVYQTTFNVLSPTRWCSAFKRIPFQCPHDDDDDHVHQSISAYECFVCRVCVHPTGFRVANSLLLHLCHSDDGQKRRIRVRGERVDKLFRRGCSGKRWLVWSQQQLVRGVSSGQHWIGAGGMVVRRRWRGVVMWWDAVGEHVVVWGWSGLLGGTQHLDRWGGGTEKDWQTAWVFADTTHVRRQRWVSIDGIVNHVGGLLGFGVGRGWIASTN